MVSSDSLLLYVLPGCPFCARVDRFLDDQGIKIEHRSVREPENADELKAIGGKVQSPCLVIDGKALYESKDIIEFLKREVVGA
ncbi:glutaredoxin-like protein [Cryptobacterium curtum DSM 15641]|uniref:Glutaredoxin-like protein n=1 Tax=Cryptobacterium curtum (strain ATCC 700683 / DSM 15641 / CCUG 43107 / 12-3) TaxID=469378 RepID=C7MKX9_CRYCD|nr:glutathione S-transferase N-terminal domain-containing protein [Cryptobacterium curtum]ACU94926.1 glutaredoxin-like protein [Cryptobacterium curtum DSM 15641]